MSDVLRIYPDWRASCSLQGLYLSLGLHKAGYAKCLIYTNFIASLDGRISEPLHDVAGFGVPRAVANARDWRLFQELAAQAQIIILSGRYIRQWAQGHAQDDPPIPDAYNDLRVWRKQEGLSEQPDLLVLTRTLALPNKVAELSLRRRIFVLCSHPKCQKKLDLLSKWGVQVSLADGEINGATVQSWLDQRGYCTAYMAAGPQVMRMMLKSRVIHRLFITQRNVIVGGGRYHTFVEGDIGLPVRLKLLTLYYDRKEEQLFYQYAVQS